MSEWIPLTEIPAESQSKVLDIVQYYDDAALSKKPNGLSIHPRTPGFERIYVRRSESGHLEVMKMDY